MPIDISNGKIEKWPPEWVDFLVTTLILLMMAIPLGWLFVVYVI